MRKTDFLGREFSPGQFIVYPGRRSSSLWMNLGYVVSVVPVEKYGLQKVKLMVHKLAPMLDWGKSTEFVSVSRLTSVTEIQRVVVIDPNTVPESVRTKLIEAAKNDLL